MREAGVADALGDLVPTSPAEVTTDDKDRIAVRTGVVLAYAVLGGHDTPKEPFVAQLRSARAGMAKLGAGAGLLSTIDDSITHVENDAASRDDFLRELDNIGYAVPEQGWGPDDRTGPLLQAGAWLAGTNVVARAIVRSGKADAADKLLRRKDVAEYFLGYVRTSGSEKAGPVAEQLEKTLTMMVTVADKPKRKRAPRKTAARVSRKTEAAVVETVAAVETAAKRAVKAPRKTPVRAKRAAAPTAA